MKVLRFVSIVSLALVSLIVLMCPGAGWALGVEGAVGAWSQTNDGGISNRGPELGISGDMKLDDNIRFQGRLKIDTVPFVPDVYLMVTQTRTNGTGSKSGGFSFDDNAFTGASFSTSLDMYEYDLALFYPVPFIKTATDGILNVEGGLNLKTLDVTLNLRQAGIDRTDSATVPIPMFYLGAQIQFIKPLDRFSLEAEFRGLSLTNDAFYDIIGRLRVNVYGPSFIAAGYRYESMSVNDGYLSIDRRVGGPFVEAGFKF
jgi:outer membrane protein